VILDVDEASLGVADRLPPEQIAASPLWRRMNAAWPWPRALQAELASLGAEVSARRPSSALQAQLAADRHESLDLLARTGGVERTLRLA
jgi:hypothetical protein